MAFLETDTSLDMLYRLRKLSVNLFSSVWPEIRLGNIIGIEQTQMKVLYIIKKILMVF